MMLSATDIWFEKNRLCIRLADKRELSVPLSWFPKLRDASSKERKNWRLIGRGVGIHWPSLDEDISVLGLLEGRGAEDA